MALRPRKQKKPRSRPPATPAEELKSAFQQLRDQRERRIRKGKKGKQKHIDDYRELVLDETKPGEFSEALLEVTASSYADRKQLLADEPTRTELKRKRSGPAPSAQQVQAEAEREARKLKKAMAKKGMPEREHYYSASERVETGEIDRTYDLETEGPQRPSEPQ